MPSIRCQAVLFDLDGVLIDSYQAIVQSWREWADRHHIDLDVVLANAYGRRSNDTIAIVAPHLDAGREADWLTEVEYRYVEMTAPYANARELLGQLADQPHAFVTSGILGLASARARYCQLPIPDVFITADDVAEGKPSPEGYLLAARRLGIDPRQCVVIEDSPAGLQAAKAGGMQAIAIGTTHPAAELTAADLIVPELKQLILEINDQGLEFTVELDK